MSGRRSIAGTGAMRRIASFGAWLLAAGVLAAAPPPAPDRPNEITFAPAQARFIRLVISATSGGQPCLDELEVYGPDGQQNLALASEGAKAAASSCLPGHAIHQVAHLNDGRYGNSHSWIAAGVADEWAQIELPRPAKVSKVVFSRDREGRYKDRMPVQYAVQLSLDGRTWQAAAGNQSVTIRPRPLPATGPVKEDDILAYVFPCEERTWRRVGDADPVSRVLGQMEAMADRFAARGLDVSKERAELAAFGDRRQAGQAAAPAPEAEGRFFFEVRLAKRRLFFRDPDLEAVEKILFVKRQPYTPSHNYSDLFDAKGGPGGAVCRLDIPRPGGRLDPAAARLVSLFDARGGVARDPVATFDLRKIYFACKASVGDYFHLMEMNADGSGLRQLTDGPFHDVYPCPLPDGGLAFVSTRCKARYLCWRPQAYVLFRMDADGRNLRPLSHANLSEWAPSVDRDGRILWTRSEYLDKGADFGHTLWAIHPDGTHPEMIFGGNTRFCYVNGREVPGTAELSATLISHGGDLNGPIAFIEASKGRSNPELVTNITPDSKPYFNMQWAREECFRDPAPLSRDLVLCSHAPEKQFGLFVIDRWGNREVLYLDPAIGSMAPTPLRPVPPPPVLSATTESAKDVESDMGQFIVADVYVGLEPTVSRGAVKYLRVCQEVRADLIQLPNGEYQKDHQPFQDWYATPIHKVAGPYGWPSYVAKAILGAVPVEEDGSANFYAPAGKVLYFQVLDANFNELQRMRSVVQLQPGERRGCIGCHEERSQAPPVRPVSALRREPSRLAPPPWGAAAFSYEKVVQPVWDAKCVRCHDAKDKQQVNFTAALDADKVPASYRTLIAQKWVHYFDCTYRLAHEKAPPMTFGTLKSRLWQVLDKGHYDVRLTPEETQRVKAWIDLNCPLWPDYVFRPNRPGLAMAPP